VAGFSFMLLVAWGLMNPIYKNVFFGYKLAGTFLNLIFVRLGSVRNAYCYILKNANIS
jgi:hypothetical protein